MAEIARDAILFGGADCAAAEAEANKVLDVLKAAGCDEAAVAGLTRKAAASLGEARSLTIARRPRRIFSGSGRRFFRGER